MLYDILMKAMEGEEVMLMDIVLVGGRVRRSNGWGSSYASSYSTSLSGSFKASMTKAAAEGTLETLALTILVPEHMF